MSGLEVIGGISAIIGIIDASIKIFDGARKDLKLSVTFETVGRRLPVILDTLQTCKNHLQSTQGSMPADVCEALEKILDACDDKAGKLRQIFEKVIPGENDAWETRYIKVVRRLGKGNKVEELMASITEDVQLVVNHRAVQSAKPEQNAELEKIIKEMRSIKPSIPEEESRAMTFDSCGGAQTNNVNSGSGQQINNNAPVTTQNFNSVTQHKEDFSFRRSVGVCLGQAPYIDPTLFVGRGAEIDKMNDVLRPGDMSQEQRRLVLGGMGGIGKTQLAISYAKHHYQDYESVFWLNAASEATLKDSFRTVAESIFDLRDPGSVERDQVLMHTRGWLSDKKNSQWLLIFDNYDSPEQFKIETYYPSASHGAIIVTTRLPYLVAGRTIRIQPLQKIEESLDILQTRSQRENVTSDPHAKRLAERLAGLPLALATAGAYLQHSSFTFERYLQEYEKRWNIYPRRPLQLQEYQDRTLYTTWGLSYIRLKSDDPDAAKLLQILAYFDNQSIWYELLRGGLTEESPEWLHEVIGDDISFDGVMGTLTDYCFLEVQTALQSWSMHACVHDWTVAALNKVINAQQYRYAFDCVAASINENDWDSLGHLSYARLAAHATRLAQDGFYQEDLAPHQLDKALYVAQLLRDQVQLAAAEQMYLRALAGRERALGAEHTLTLNTVNNLGLLYVDQGKLVEAEQIYLQALAGYEKALGAEHTSTLNTVNNLGNLYGAQGKLVEAEQIYLRALAGYEMALGAEHTSTLNTVNNLGSLYRDQGKLAEAEQMYLRALAGYEKGLGAEHTSTLTTVNNLGNLYRDQGKLVEAEQMYLRALAGYEKALRAEHTSTLRTVNNLGNLYRDQGKLAEAEQMYLRALAGYEKTLGAEHTSTLRTVNNLGLLYRNQGKLVKAEQMYLRALAGYEKGLKAEHTSTLTTVNNLGSLYRDQGKLAEAEQMYLRALAGYEKALGAKHTSTLNTVNNLGNLYRDRGRLAEAEQMYLRALAGYKKALGAEHTLTLNTVNNLGLLYVDQGKLVEAEQIYLQALAGYEKALGAEHTSTLNTVNNLGSLYRDQGKLAEAEQMYLRALAGYEKGLGAEHTSTLTTVNNLGNLYRDQGQLVEAEQMYLRALAGYEMALGAKHTSTLSTVNNLGNLYVDQGKLVEAEQIYLRALAGYKKALGAEHTSTLNTVNNLGGLYRAQGKLVEGEQMYLQALAGYEIALGAEHTSTLRTVNNLGLLYRDQGKLVEAEQMYLRALAGYEMALGAKHTSTLSTVNNLGNLYRDQGKLGEMIDLVSTWASRAVNLFGNLGRLLVQNLDDRNAQMALQQQIDFQDGRLVFANIRCDGCGLQITCAKKRFVCRHCSDGDLCGQCFNEYQFGIRKVPNCLNHPFLAIISDSLSEAEHAMLSVETRRVLWFQDLKRQYPKVAI